MYSSFASCSSFTRRLNVATSFCANASLARASSSCCFNASSERDGDESDEVDESSDDPLLVRSCLLAVAADLSTEISSRASPSQRSRVSASAIAAAVRFSASNALDECSVIRRVASSSAVSAAFCFATHCAASLSKRWLSRSCRRSRDSSSSRRCCCCCASLYCDSENKVNLWPGRRRLHTRQLTFSPSRLTPQSPPLH